MKMDPPFHNRLAFTGELPALFLRPISRTQETAPTTTQLILLSCPLALFDLSAGTLPAFSYFIPNENASDHPCHDIRLGEALLKDVYESVRQPSPLPPCSAVVCVSVWEPAVMSRLTRSFHLLKVRAGPGWNRTLLFVTYDDAGPLPLLPTLDQPTGNCHYRPPLRCSPPCPR